MTTLRTTRRFERDAKQAQRRQKDLDKLWAVVDRLLAGERLDPRHQPSAFGPPMVHQVHPSVQQLTMVGFETRTA